MIQKLVKITALSLLLLLPLNVYMSNIVHAESSYESNATITFTEGEGAPPVLDPEKLDEIFQPGVKPGDPSDLPTIESGPLTLDYVSSLDFSQHAIESNTMTYESTILRPFIKVTDRRGTGAGWHVTAQLSEFTDGKNPSLPGAVIVLNYGTVVSPTEGGEPIPENPVILNAGGAATLVVSAAENNGLGTWITRWFPVNPSSPEFNDSVTLQIPAGAATIGDHSATITWTLYDAPGQ